MPLILFSSPRFADHETPPGHPERTERADVMEGAASRWRDQGVQVAVPAKATVDQLARVHDREYVRRIAETVGKAKALDPDTYTSADSFEVALLAAGAAVDAAEWVMAGQHRSAFALVRP